MFPTGNGGCYARSVENNAETYALLRDAFCASGRYHRTMGNHDDVFADPYVADHLGTHLPGVEVADTILLSPDGGAADERVGRVGAV